MKRILIALLLAAALIVPADAVREEWLEDQCDPEFTPAECARLG